MDKEISEIKVEETVVKKKKTINFNWKKIGIVASIILVVFLVLGILIGIPASKAYSDGKKAYASALGIKDAAKSQDIKKITENIVATKKQIIAVKSDLGAIGWTKFIPFLGSYTSDAEHFVNAGVAGLEAAEISAKAVEPYSDLLGLKGQGTFAGGTTEERIAKVVETLGKVTPQIDAVADKMAIVKKEIDQVDPNRYPETFAGKQIRSKLVDAKSIVDVSGDFLAEARPMVKKLPQLLGANGEAKYMVLFQNDKELRPTGGFLTAYAVFRVEKGKIHLNSSDDIYKLDNSISKRVDPPAPIKKYLQEYGWFIRNANFSPDYLSSMKSFEDMYANSTQKEKVDGIIAVDTHVLVKIMDVIGPVQIYGSNFTTKIVASCNCPMVIYELEKYADEPKAYERGSRKDIIGVLLSEIMKKALSAPKQIYGPLFQAMIDEARQKHVLFYFKDEDSQKGIEAIGFGGRIRTYDGDYLHVNDANLGGAKSNLYVLPSIKQDVSITDSGADEKLTIEYKYPRAADNCSLERKEGLCLAGIYRDYVRIYLPKGAVISDVRGFENTYTTFEDLGHTVVDGFFTVVPQGMARIELKYKVAGNFKKNGEYKSLIQKQPGTDQNKFTLTVNGKAQTFNLIEDKEVVVKL